MPRDARRTRTLVSWGQQAKPPGCLHTPRQPCHLVPLAGRVTASDLHLSIPWQPKGLTRALSDPSNTTAQNSPCTCPAGQVTTWDNQLLIFGGHGNDKDLTGSRWYNGNTGQVASNRMASGRWYPGACGVGSR